MRRGAGADQLVGDALGLIDRNRKAKSDRTALRIRRITAQCGNRRVDANQLSGHVDQRAPGVTGVDRGVGLDGVEHGVLVARLTVVDTGRLSALTMPVVTVPSRPSGEPTAITGWPTRKLADDPRLIGVSPEMFCTRTTAMSVVGSE